jgi:MFS family permease
MLSLAEKKLVNANIWKYQLFQILLGLQFFLPYSVVYIQTLGYSLAQTMLFIAISTLMMFVWEIPAGYIADKIGRKNSILIYAILAFLGLLCFYFAQNVVLLILSQLLLGTGASFRTGADSSFLYDSLLDLNRAKEFKKIQGRSILFFEISVIVAMFVAMFAVPFGIRNILLMVMLTFVLLFFLVLSFHEPKHHRNKLGAKLNFSEFFKIVKNSIQDKYLLALFVFAFIIGGSMNTIFRFYQPYFDAIKLALPNFALMFIIFSVVSGIFSFFAHKFEKKLGVLKSLVVMFIALIFAYFGAGIFFSIVGVGFFLLREIVRGLYFPIMQDYVHRCVTSNIRATVLSVQNLFSRCGLLVISVLFGFFVDWFKMSHVYIGMGILLSFIMIVYFLIFRKQLIIN